MNKDLDKKKSYYLLELALEERLEHDPYMQKYKEDTENLHEFSEEHNKRMKKLFKMAEKVERKAVRRQRNYRIAAGVAIFLCFSTVAVTQVEAFRLPIVRLFMEMKEKSALIGTEQENRLQLTNEYVNHEPTYVPKGYVVVAVEESEDGFYVKYEEAEGDNWYMFHYWARINVVDSDNEEGVVYEENINGKPAVIIQKDDEVRISINVEMQRFYLTGTISYEEAVKIMSSINF